MAQQRPCWHADIIYEIFYHLSAFSTPFSTDDKLGLAALARCARSGKPLFEPAIDVLWRQVDSLTIVLGVLSPVFRKLEKEKFNTYGFTAEVPEAAYQRLHYYAARVQKLTHHAEMCRIHPEVFATMYDHLRGQSLLPRLQSFHWSQRSPADVREILPLIPPSLRDLGISGIGVENVRPSRGQPDTEYFCKFIHALNAVAPSLETLSLSGNIEASSIVCLGQLSHLKSLNIINFAHHGFGSGYIPVLRSCAGFDLQEFGINLIDQESLTDVVVDGFHSLRTLRVHGTLSLVTRFLSHVSSPELTSFGAYVRRPDRWEDYRTCLSVLTTRFASSLRAVRLSGSWSGNMASLAHPLDVISPLLVLRQLEDVCILSVTGVALSFSADDAFTLAKAWPRLRNFQMLYQSLLAGLPINALGAFAAHCPDLHTLWLASVDFRRAGERQLEPCLRAANHYHGLRHIWLPGDVEAAGVSRVARFIDAIFPNVDPRPVEYPWHPSRNANGWEKMLVSLRGLREVKAAQGARLGKMPASSDLPTL